MIHDNPVATPGINTSVIIPTYNGAGTILNIIRSLEVQSTRNFEVLVIIDGSSDNTSLLLVNGIFNLRSFRLIEQDNRGRAEARNRGALEAQGELLIFYDDDTVPNADSVSRHIEFHEKNAHALCCGYIIEDEKSLITDIQFFRDYLNKKWTKKFQPGYNLLNEKNLFLTAANLSIKAGDFRELNGFNRLLTDAEDLDLAIRAVKSGHPVFFDKSNVSCHYDQLTCKNYILRLREYQAANLILNPLKDEVFKLAPKKPLSGLHGFKKIFFSFFSHKTWVHWIDQEKLRFLPRILRFKIYDWVITGLSSFYTNKEI